MQWPIPQGPSEDATLRDLSSGTIPATVLYAASIVASRRDSAGPIDTGNGNHILSDQPVEHLGIVLVRQPLVAAAALEGDLAVVQAQEVQDRGVQVRHLDAVLDGVVAQLVGGAVGLAALHAAPG